MGLSEIVADLHEPARSFRSWLSLTIMRHNASLLCAEAWICDSGSCGLADSLYRSAQSVEYAVELPLCCCQSEDACSGTEVKTSRGEICFVSVDSCPTSKRPSSIHNMSCNPLVEDPNRLNSFARLAMSGFKSITPSRTVLSRALPTATTGRIRSCVTAEQFDLLTQATTKDPRRL